MLAPSVLRKPYHESARCGSWLQIAACDASVVSVEDIPAEELERERQIELQKEDLASKPEKFRFVHHDGSDAAANLNRLVSSASISMTIDHLHCSAMHPSQAAAFCIVIHVQDTAVADQSASHSC